MISVIDLLTDGYIPSNYFSPTAYIQSELELGLLKNREGDRLIALPETLIQGIYAGLNSEIGQASRLVLFNCGRWWGKNFYSRFQAQLSDYYNQSFANLAMLEFIQALKQCWVTHGWGTIDLDCTYQTRGFLVVQIWNSPFAKQVDFSTQPICHLEAGILASFFSQLAGRELHCLQTTCESMKADCNRFVLGLPQRLEAAETMIINLDHDQIMQHLCS
jgi:predicted hydrocarbon binding protein